MDRTTLFALVAFALAGCGDAADLMMLGPAADASTPSPDADLDPQDAAVEPPVLDAGVDAGADLYPDASDPLPDSGMIHPSISACTMTALPPGDHLFELEHGGLTREYELHVPASYDGTSALPMVLYFHPLGTNRRYLTRVGTTELSESANFLAVYPGGRRGSWNGGACCGPANGAGLGDEVDDVGFVRAMVDQLRAVVCIDDARIYATGFSNGGFLSHRLACEASDLIAAIAPVSSVNGLPGGACEPPRAVPVLAINGTADNLVPYDGGFGFPGVTTEAFVSVAATFAGWATANGCLDAAPAVTFENGAARCESYTTCAGGVEVSQCTITGGGHCWFGEPVCALGANSSDLLATDATWAFLSRFRKP